MPEPQPRAFSYVRFSTPDQAKGDSHRRQVEAAAEYARQHGLELDDRLRMTDHGLSAFKGHHRARGALGEFLRRVEAGAISPGSMLIVESLDRLSRQQPTEAFEQFTALTRAGIRVVTLSDGQEYTLENINRDMGKLFISMGVMVRAHEESVTKSQRGKAAWSAKRQRAANNGEKMTAKTPGWLRLSSDRKRFEVIEDRAEIIRSIFAARLAGKGTGRIARELNETPNIWVPRRANGWHESYINKVLRTRAVIGDLALNGSEDSLLRGYYPAVVDRDTYERVQRALRENATRRGNAGGRNGAVKNLFGHRAFCAHCAGPMAYINKGAAVRGAGQYLQCDRARRGLGCDKSTVRYRAFEATVLNFCVGLDVAELLDDQGSQTELAERRGDLEAAQAELATVREEASNLRASIARTSNTAVAEALEADFAERLEHDASLTARCSELGRQIEALTTQERDTERRLADMQVLWRHMDELGGPERIEFRTRLRAQLRALIDWIRVDAATGKLLVFFATGRLRTLTLAGDHVRDAYPAKFPRTPTTAMVRAKTREQR